MTFLGFATRSFPEGAHTVADAAAAVGVAAEQIVKSLVLKRASGEPLLVAASGTNRVDLDRVAGVVGEPVAMARATWVRDVTGYAIGGVPPAGHARDLQTLVDRDLLAFDEVWAAAGSPFEVFALTPAELVELTRGTVADVAAR